MLFRAVKATVRFLPTDMAFEATRLLAGLPPPRPPLRDRDREIRSRSRRFEFGHRSRKVGWTWGNGPRVVFVHGWGGRGAQLAALADHVTAQGFQAVVLDVTAHGESKGWRVSFEDFVSDVREIHEYLDRDVYAYVGHSAGGMCMMAARQLEGIQAHKYVCICAPRAPYVPIHMIRDFLDVSEPVIERCKAYFSAQLGASWDELDRGRAFTHRPSERLLLIYDESDDQVDHRDGEMMQSLWPSAKLRKTYGLGHRKVLWDPEVAGEVVSFLRNGVRHSPTA